MVSNTIDLDDYLRRERVLYVFGYGSLTWKPDFASTRQNVGFIKGYRRVFWQGSVFHRGTPQRPGRCATLTKASPNEECWGLVFELRGKEQIAKCLDHLQLREQSLGCYDVNIVPCYLKCPYGKTITVDALIYHALPKNNLWLGEASLSKLSMEIATSFGVAGSNVEYLFKLCDFMRKYAPGARDAHLFGIERHIRQWLGISVKKPDTWDSLMKNRKFCDHLRKCDVNRVSVK